MNDSDGLQEHIIDNETGYVALDEIDLARKIEHIFNNYRTAKMIAQNGSRYVSDKYSIENMKNAYKRFYREILSK